MKKQIKKLSLNKKTITNLEASEMNRKVGGYYTAVKCGGNGSYNCGTGQTKNGNTCYGHKICNGC